MPHSDALRYQQQQQPRGSGILILSVFLGLVTLVSLLLVGLSLARRSDNAQARAAERRELVAEALTYTCREIEKLKAGERDAAWKSYRELDKNLKLLRLARTPAIQKAAVEARDAKLARYRATRCPIQGRIP